MDASQQRDVQEWIPAEIHQTSPGRYRASCDLLSLGDIHIVRERQNQAVHKAGATPRDVCTVSLTFTKNPVTRFSNFADPAASSLFFLPGGVEFDVVLPPNAETLYVCLPQGQLESRGRKVARQFWDTPPQRLFGARTPFRTAVGTGLHAMLDYHLATGHLAIKNLATLQTAVFDSILQAFNNATNIADGNTPGLRSRLRSHQLVKQAREVIDAELDAGRVPSVIELCSQTGVSERTLQYAFRRELQVTPCAYMRILRLNRVRATLRSAECTKTKVTDVATEWCFFHMSKFAQDYYRLFGEHPSETLKRTQLAR